MKNILCATDYSPNSLLALKMAYSLADRLGSVLTILHVFDFSATLLAPTSLAYNRREQKAFKKHKERLGDWVKEHVKSSAEHSEIRMDVAENSSAAEGIIKKAKDCAADLIVVGMKGATNLESLLFGSTASYLIDKAFCPVLIVPENVKEFEIRSIVYASAFEESDIQAISWLTKLADPLNAGIKVVHISNRGEYAGEDQMNWFQEMLREEVNYPKLDFKLIFSDDTFGSLMDTIKAENSQMIAMLERSGQTLIKSLWHRDLVKRMKSERIVPVISINKAILTKIKDETTPTTQHSN